MLLQSFFMFGFLILLLSTVYLYFELRNTNITHKKEKKENSRRLFELTILSELLIQKVFMSYRDWETS